PAAPVAFRVDVRPFLCLAVRKSRVSHETYLADFLGLPVCESYVCHLSKTMARRHTYRREEPRFGSVHGRTNASSVAVVVHRACCSAYPSYATSAAMDGPPSPGTQKTARFSCGLPARCRPSVPLSWAGVEATADSSMLTLA